ncbi:MAG: hypothetical protein HQ579_08430, partial [Candidatus Omnitrophica bacterium]|nr:hypothetical protein [Candidatus Omnitrophota bacterium]
MVRFLSPPSNGFDCAHHSFRACRGGTHNSQLTTHNSCDWRKRYAIFFKIVAIALIFAFLLYDITWAQAGAPIWKDAKPNAFANTVSGVNTIFVPDKAGQIETAFQGALGETVINIKDAHASLSAQYSIVELLKDLVTNYNLNLIAVEGSEGYIDTSVLKTFPDKEIRKETADYLMEKGRMSAGEFFSIVSDNDIALYGIEDNALYRKNVESFKSIIEDSARCIQNTEALLSVLGRLGKKIYKKELEEFIRKSASHKEGAMSFSEYWTYISKLTERLKISTGEYTNIAKILFSMELERKINFKKATAEREALINELGERVSREKLEEIVKRSLSFREGRISAGRFHSYLISIAEGQQIDPVPYPNLINFARYISLYEDTDIFALYAEVDNLEAEVRKVLFTAKNEKQLYDLETRAEILKGLFNIKLNNREIDYLTKHRDAFSAADFAQFIDKNYMRYGMAPQDNYDLDYIMSRVNRALDFYDTVQKRNTAMIKNTVTRMRNEGRDVAALVTGGFHTKGLGEIMEEKGLSYLVIAPKFEESKERPYIAVLTSKKEPYEELIKAGGYELAVNQFFSCGSVENLALTAALALRSLEGEKLAAKKEFWKRAYKSEYESLPEGRRQALSAARLKPQEFSNLLDLFTPEAMESIRGLGTDDIDTRDVLEAIDYRRKWPSIIAHDGRIHPDVKEILPSRAPKHGRHSVGPILAPKKPGRLFGEEDIRLIAKMAGQKRVMAEDDNIMTYASGDILSHIMQEADYKYTIGLATGGTTEAVRKLLGMGEMISAIYGAQIDPEKILRICTLDNYYFTDYLKRMGFSEEEAEKVTTLSSYESEQLFMMIENLMGGDLKKGFFIAPPGRTDLDWFDSAAAFRMLLLKYFCVKEFAQLWQLHGIGSNSHDAFNEVYKRLKREIHKVTLEFYKSGEVKTALLADGKDLVQYGLWNIPEAVKIPRMFSQMGILRDDHASFISFIIQVQNAGHFIPRKFHPFFLKFMSDKSLYDLDEFILAIQLSTEEELLSYTKSSEYHFRDMQHFVDELNYLLEQFMNVPLESTTQGTKEMLDRGSLVLPDGTYPLQLFMACAAHKQLAVLRALQSPSDWSTASVTLHMAKSALFVATEESLGMVSDIDTMNTFFKFKPENPNVGIATDENIKLKWKKTPPGKIITGLLEEGKHAFRPVSWWSLLGLGGGLDWTALFSGAFLGFSYFMVLNLEYFSQASLFAAPIIAIITLMFAVTSFRRTATSVIASTIAIRKKNPEIGILKAILKAFIHDIGHDELALSILRKLSPASWQEIVIHEQFKSHVPGLMAFVPAIITKKAIKELEKELGVEPQSLKERAENVR